MRVIHFVPLLLLALGASSLRAQTPNVDRGIPAQHGLVGLKDVKLKPGVDPADFERFVVRTFVPEASRFYPGAKFLVLKGDRGAEVGSYLFVLIFDTKEIRDLYFPAEGEPSAIFMKIAEAYGGMDELRILYDEFARYADITERTDYAAIQ